MAEFTDYANVTIGGTAGETFTTYASVEDADAYMLGAAGEAADAWRALGSGDDGIDTKGRALISMTRTLDRQKWKGEKSDPLNEHAWPRMNTGVDGVVDDAIPQAIIDATIEGAAMLNNGDSFGTTTPNDSNNVQSLNAKGVSISYFRTGAPGTGPRFPLPLMELIGNLLAGGSFAGIAGATATGTDGCTITGNSHGYTRGL
jgi:hypothetical protein